MKTSETAKIDVSVPDTKEESEVGFDFIVGKKRLKKMVWSKRLETSITEMSNDSFNRTRD